MFELSECPRTLLQQILHCLHPNVSKQQQECGPSWLRFVIAKQGLLNLLYNTWLLDQSYSCRQILELADKNRAWSAFYWQSITGVWNNSTGLVTYHHLWLDILQTKAGFILGSTLKVLLPHLLCPYKVHYVVVWCAPPRKCNLTTVHYVFPPTHFGFMSCCCGGEGIESKIHNMYMCAGWFFYDSITILADVHKFVERNVNKHQPDHHLYRGEEPLQCLNMKSPP